MIWQILAFEIKNTHHRADHEINGAGVHFLHSLVCVYAFFHYTIRSKVILIHQKPVSYLLFCMYQIEKHRDQ